MRAASLTRLVIAAVACSALAIPATAAPQWGRDRDDRGWQGRVSGEAYQRGYRDGQRLGNEDERRNRAFSYQSHREYRDAEQGYDRNDGSRERYRDEFRRGFVDGYSAAYRSDRRDGWGQRDDRRDGRWGQGNNNGSRDPGQVRGFSDGYEKGLRDRRDDHRFQPERFKEVKQGTAPGYRDEFGSRQRYTFSYRDGFHDGYEDGFRSRTARR